MHLRFGTRVSAGWLREQQTSPIMLLLEIALFAPTVSLLLCWLMPTFFLGQDSQSLLRALAALMPAKLQRHPLG